MSPMVAKVTYSDGARLHLDEAGNAHCGAGNGRTIATTARPLAEANASMLCRRCIKAIRAAADKAISDFAGGGQSQYRTRSIEPLRRLRDKIRTPQEIAAAEAFRARWETAQERKANWKPSALGQMKQDHAAANERYRTEQLTLIAA